MKETEKAIIATAIEYPETRFFFFENCDADFFISPHAAKIFKVMKSLYLEDRKFDWATLIDLCEVPDEYFSLLPGALKAVYDSKAFIRENVILVKNIRAKRDLLREINKEDIEGRVNDFIDLVQFDIALVEGE